MHKLKLANTTGALAGLTAFFEGKTPLKKSEANQDAIRLAYHHKKEEWVILAPNEKIPKKVLEEREHSILLIDPKEIHKLVKDGVVQIEYERNWFNVSLVFAAMFVLASVLFYGALLILGAGWDIIILALCPFIIFTAAVLVYLPLEIARYLFDAQFLPFREVLRSIVKDGFLIAGELLVVELASSVIFLLTPLFVPAGLTLTATLLIFALEMIASVFLAGLGVGFFKGASKAYNHFKSARKDPHTSLLATLFYSAKEGLKCFAEESLRYVGGVVLLVPKAAARTVAFLKKTIHSGLKAACFPSSPESSSKAFEEEGTEIIDERLDVQERDPDPVLPVRPGEFSLFTKAHEALTTGTAASMPRMLSVDRLDQLVEMNPDQEPVIRARANSY